MLKTPPTLQHQPTTFWSDELLWSAVPVPVLASVWSLVVFLSGCLLAMTTPSMRYL